MAGALRDGLASHSAAPLHPRPAREPLAHTLPAHTHTKIVALLFAGFEEPAVAVAERGR